MNLKVEVVDGVANVTDSDTGKAMPWVHTVDIVMPPGATPVLYLGTFAFSATVAAAAAPPAAGPAPGAAKP